MSNNANLGWEPIWYEYNRYDFTSFARGIRLNLRPLTGVSEIYIRSCITLDGVFNILGNNYKISQVSSSPHFALYKEV